MKRWTLLAALSIALVAAVACSSDEPDAVPTSVPIPTVETSAPAGGGSGNTWRRKGNNNRPNWAPSASTIRAKL